MDGAASAAAWPGALPLDDPVEQMNELCTLIERASADADHCSPAALSSLAVGRVRRVSSCPRGLTCDAAAAAAPHSSPHCALWHHADTAVRAIRTATRTQHHGRRHTHATKQGTHAAQAAGTGSQQACAARVRVRRDAHDSSVFRVCVTAWQVASDSVRLELELSSPSSATEAAAAASFSSPSPSPRPSGRSPPHTQPQSPTMQAYSQFHRGQQQQHPQPHQRHAGSFDFDPAEHHSSRSPSRFFSRVATAAAASVATSPRGGGAAAARPASVAHVHVHSSGGLTVSPPSARSGGYCVRLLSCCRSRRWFWLCALYLFFFLYMVVVPAILILIFYLSPAQMIVAVLFALGVPMVGYQFIHRGEMQRRRSGDDRRRIRRQQQQQQQMQQSASDSAAGIEMQQQHLASPSRGAVVDFASSAVPSQPPHDHDPDHDSLHPHGISGFKAFWHIVSNHYAYELYQLLLTLVSVGSYLFYTYHLSFTAPDPAAPDALWGYTLRMGPNASDPEELVSAIQQFVQVEYFLIVSLAFDYLLRLGAASSKSARLLNLYSLFDLASFTCVAYVNVFHAEFAPKHVHYNVYLFQGPFRFMRMRRALASLDRPIRRRATATAAATEEATAAAAAVATEASGASSRPRVHAAKIPPLYRLGPLTLSKRTAFLLLLLFKILLFICSAAALVLALEFPCAAVAPADLVAGCTTQLQRFHIAVYFLVVSLSTVGYGDVNAATDLGRCLMTAIIIVALIEVPRQIQAMNDVNREEEEESMERTRIMQQQQQQCRLAQIKQEEHESKESSPSPSAAASWSAPASSSSAAAAALPSCLFPALSSSSSAAAASSFPASGSSGGLALSPSVCAFLVDDRAFLCRWAESVLAVRVASDPAWAQRMARALDAEGAGSTGGQAQGPLPVDAARLVQQLFAPAVPKTEPPPPPPSASPSAPALAAALAAAAAASSTQSGWHA